MSGTCKAETVLTLMDECLYTCDICQEEYKLDDIAIIKRDTILCVGCAAMEKGQ